MKTNFDKQFSSYTINTLQKKHGLSLHTINMSLIPYLLQNLPEADFAKLRNDPDALEQFIYRHSALAVTQKPTNLTKIFPNPIYPHAKYLSSAEIALMFIVAQNLPKATLNLKLAATIQKLFTTHQAFTAPKVELLGVSKYLNSTESLEMIKLGSGVKELGPKINNLKKSVAKPLKINTLPIGVVSEVLKYMPNKTETVPPFQVWSKENKAIHSKINFTGDTQTLQTTITTRHKKGMELLALLDQKELQGQELTKKVRALIINEEAQKNIDTNVNIMDVDGINPLYCALTLHQTNNDIVQTLLDAGANPDQLDYEGTTPLIYSMWNSKYLTARMLLKAGANSNIKDPKGNAPLHNACSKPHVDLDLIKTFVEKDANLDILDAGGNTPLLLAIIAHERLDAPLRLLIAKKKLDVVKILLDGGANKNLPDLDGNTPLMNAIKNHFLDAANLLIAKGANTTAQNHEGKTAKHFAIEHGYRDLAKYLIVTEKAIQELNNQSPVELMTNDDNHVQIDGQQEEVGEQAEVPIDIADNTVNALGVLYNHTI